MSDRLPAASSTHSTEGPAGKEEEEEEEEEVEDMIGIIVDHVGCDDHLLVVIDGADHASIDIASVVAILDDLLLVVADLVVVGVDDLLTDLLAIGVGDLFRDSEVGCSREG